MIEHCMQDDLDSFGYHSNVRIHVVIAKAEFRSSVDERKPKRKETLPMVRQVKWTMNTSESSAI